MWSAGGPANESEHRCININIKLKQWESLERAWQMYIFDHMIIKYDFTTEVMPPVWLHIKLLAATNWSSVSKGLFVTSHQIKSN